MWRVIPGQDLRHRSWDDEIVVYNDLTGDTHLVSTDAMLVLLALRAAAKDEASLVATLSADAQADAGDVAALVASLLDQLSGLSLIDQNAC